MKKIKFGNYWKFKFLTKNVQAYNIRTTTFTVVDFCCFQSGEKSSSSLQVCIDLAVCNAYLLNQDMKFDKFWSKVLIFKIFVHTSLLAAAPLVISWILQYWLPRPNVSKYVPLILEPYNILPPYDYNCLILKKKNFLRGSYYYLAPKVQ